MLEHLHEGQRGHRVRPQMDHSRARHVRDRNLVFALISAATHLAWLSLSGLSDAVERVRTAGTRRPSDVAFLADLGFGKEAPLEALYREQAVIVIAPVADPVPNRAKRARTDRKEPAAASDAKPRRRTAAARSLAGATPLLGHAQPGRRGVRDGAAPGRDRQRPPVGTEAEAGETVIVVSTGIAVEQRMFITPSLPSRYLANSRRRRLVGGGGAPVPSPPSRNQELDKPRGPVLTCAEVVRCG